MAWTADDLAAAKAALLLAITSGKSVAFGGRAWTSHDLPALQALVAEIERSASASPPSRLAAFTKDA